MQLILKYFLSGIVINTFGFFSYVILLKFFNFSPTLSASILFPLTLLIYYLTQSLFVFKNKINEKKIFFFINYLFLYFLNILLLFIFVTEYSFEPIVTQFFIMLFLIIINFLIQKNFIFK
jgi:putative flippase GtrA